MFCLPKTAWPPTCTGAAVPISLGAVGILPVALLVLAIGLSLGGPTGYAINPARDFGPRLFGTLVGTQGLWSSGYWWIPLIIPVIGGVLEVGS